MISNLIFWYKPVIHFPFHYSSIWTYQIRFPNPFPVGSKFLHTNQMPFFLIAVWTVLKIFMNILFHWKIKNRTNKKITESIAAFIMREWALFKLLSLKNDPPSSFSNDSLYWVTARFLAVNISSSIFFFSKKLSIIKNGRYSIYVPINMLTIYSCSFLSFKSLRSSNSWTISILNCCKYLSADLVPPNFGLLLYCKKSRNLSQMIYNKSFG